MGNIAEHLLDLLCEHASDTQLVEVMRVASATHNRPCCLQMQDDFREDDHRDRGSSTYRPPAETETPVHRGLHFNASLRVLYDACPALTDPCRPAQLCHHLHVNMRQSVSTECGRRCASRKSAVVHASHDCHGQRQNSPQKTLCGGHDPSVRRSGSDGTTQLISRIPTKLAVQNRPG
jgi:hypothetical protein